jgi:hypothetical protein
MIFASKSLRVHLARGVLGFGALAAAAALARAQAGWALALALALLPLGFLALRGCPMCWTVGLIQTVAAKVRGKATDALCADGSCRRDLR